jgi:hypothetical protein
MVTDISVTSPWALIRRFVYGYLIQKSFSYIWRLAYSKEAEVHSWLADVNKERHADNPHPPLYTPLAPSALLTVLVYKDA